jgi:hypothetical protein
MLKGLGGWSRISELEIHDVSKRQLEYMAFKVADYGESISFYCKRVEIENVETSDA